MSARLRGALVLAALALLVLELGLLLRVPAPDELAGSSRGALPGAAVEQPPDDLPPVGATLDVRVTKDGDLEVDHWIRSRVPLQRLRLASYRPAELPSAPTASDVVLTGDGRTVTRGARVGATPRVYRLERPARLVHLTYRLTGALDREGSVPGRALLRATALDVGYQPRSGPVRLSVGGVSVLNLACAPPGESQALAAPCGGPVTGGWAVRLGPAQGTDRVIAQVELGTSGPSASPSPTAAAAAGPARTP